MKSGGTERKLLKLLRLAKINIRDGIRERLECQ